MALYRQGLGPIDVADAPPNPFVDFIFIPADRAVRAGRIWVQLKAGRECSGRFHPPDLRIGIPGAATHLATPDNASC
jgi:hypothetical protein